MTEKNRKRGFTLTELVIVLLIVTVMTGMVISFTVLINNYTRQSTNRLAIAEEIQRAELVVRHWISSFDRESCDIYVGGTGIIRAHEGDPNTTYTINISENEDETRRLEASYPDGTPRFTAVEFIYAVRFNEIKDSTTGRTLIYCTFVYMEPAFREGMSDTVMEHTFLVSTRVAF